MQIPMEFTKSTDLIISSCTKVNYNKIALGNFIRYPDNNANSDGVRKVNGSDYSFH